MNEQSQTTQDIKNLLHKGNFTVYTILNHVSRSGMTRGITCFVVVNNEPVVIDWYIDKLGLFKLGTNGLKVSGAGMDMGFHVVYELSATLYGYKDRGAYKLNQRWI